MRGMGTLGESWGEDENECRQSEKVTLPHVYTHGLDSLPRTPMPEPPYCMAQRRPPSIQSRRGGAGRAERTEAEALVR